MADKDLGFGKRLEKLIHGASLTKKALADKISVSPSTVGIYVNEGRIPEAPILLKISQALNVSMEELLTGKPISTQENSLTDFLETILEDKEINLDKEKKTLIRGFARGYLKRQSNK